MEREIEPKIEKNTVKFIINVAYLNSSGGSFVFCVVF